MAKLFGSDSESSLQEQGVGFNPVNQATAPTINLNLTSQGKKAGKNTRVDVDVLTQVTDFDAIAQAFGVATESVKASERTAENAFDLGDKALQAADDLVDRGFDAAIDLQAESLDFAGETLESTISSIENQGKLTTEFASQIVTDNLSALDSILEFADASVESTLSNVVSTQETFVEALADAQESAFGIAAKTVTTENEAILDQVGVWVKWAALAFLGVAIITRFSN